MEAAMKARVTVMLKTGVLDPQGEAVRHALGSLGFAGVQGVRQGKVIELDLTETDAAKAGAETPEGPDGAPKPGHHVLRTTAGHLISLDDEGGGLFVVIRQEDNLDTNEVKIDPEEWPAIRAAVNRMARECAKGKQ